MTPMSRINITLDLATIALLDQIEDQTGASRSEAIRRGVEAYAQLLVERGFPITAEGTMRSAVVRMLTGKPASKPPKRTGARKVRKG